MYTHPGQRDIVPQGNKMEKTSEVTLYAHATSHHYASCGGKSVRSIDALRANWQFRAISHD